MEVYKAFLETGREITEDMWESVHKKAENFMQSNGFDVYELISVVSSRPGKYEFVFGFAKMNIPDESKPVEEVKEEMAEEKPKAKSKRRK